MTRYSGTTKHDAHIPPALISRLSGLLVEVLVNARIVGNMFLSAGDRLALRLIENTMPQHGPLHDALVHYVSENPFSDFALGWLSDRLAINEYEDGERQLSDIPGFGDIEAVAVALLGDFSLIPRTYIVSIPLPTIFQEIMDRDTKLQFNENLSIVCANKDGDGAKGTSLVEKWLPLTSGDAIRDKRQLQFGGEGLLAFVSNVPVWNGAYLQITESGYINDILAGSVDHRIQETIRSFFGLFIAHGLVTRRPTWTAKIVRTPILYHQHGPNGYRLVRRSDMDATTSRTLSELYYDDGEGQFADTSFKRALVAEIGAEVAKAFEGNDEVAHLRRAARWLFDSYSNDDQLMAFLQAMVVLETVLGADKSTSQLVGLNELLRNRCAYLIGESASERAEIMREFSAIYEVRSKIVHTGKSRISGYERTLFHKLRQYCARVLKAELKLLPEAVHYPKRVSPATTD